MAKKTGVINDDIGFSPLLLLPKVGASSSLFRGGGGGWEEDGGGENRSMGSEQRCQNTLYNTFCLKFVFFKQPLTPQAGEYFRSSPPPTACMMVAGCLSIHGVKHTEE